MSKKTKQMHEVITPETEKLRGKEICVLHGITYQYYQDESEIPAIKKLMDLDLSEPYSIFTYRYFLQTWPSLCIVCYDKGKDKDGNSYITKENPRGKCVGAIICKIEEKKFPKRGYIAMVVVDREYRKRKMGSTQVIKIIEEMKKNDVVEVVLETEVINKGALILYEKLGFMRTKRLCKYYLNGGDAFRLKLPLK